MIDEWVGGLGAPLAQWEVMRRVSPLEVVGPLPAYAPLFRFFLFLNSLENLSKKISLAKRNSSIFIFTKVHLALFQVALLRLFS